MNAITLPVLLSFDGKGGFKPGRGEAGWTVYRFGSVEARAEFMRTHQASRMPCWARYRGEEPCTVCGAPDGAPHAEGCPEVAS